MNSIEIWSDLVCPFCYIGKRNLETALQKMGMEESVQIEWKSFQLDPEAKKATIENPISTYEYLSKKYGKPLGWAKQITFQTAETAKKVGLDLNFEKAINTNTMDAHRLLHFAKSQNKQGELKERLLKAHFTEGLNLSDFNVLARLASDVGLDSGAVLKILDSEEYVADVQEDAETAQGLGATGVPFFVFNRQYAISGAQPVEAFQQVLAKVREDGSRPVG
jgi:predicted DsbA family dithiol-disulfide isomerase